MYPLLEQSLDRPVVIVDGRPVSRQGFVNDVLWWANVLPDKPYVINLCRDRYRFMLAFFAAGVRGHCTLLPPGQQPTHVHEIRALYPDAMILCDNDDQDFEEPTFRITGRPATAETIARVPKLDGDRLAAIVFTSGSTGTSKPIEKFWRTMYDGAYLNAFKFFDEEPNTATLFATVPPWHMYGLEWSVMIPMVSDFAVYSCNTFFLDDIRVALNNVQDGRILITTPLHLRALIKSGIEYPELSGVLCATSPLSAELAQAAENYLLADLIEIYGCSEIGSMAVRRPTQSESWRFFPEIKIRQTDDDVYVSATHVPEGVTLSDTLSFDADGSFILEGRSADLIKVAGKRTSLGELNNRLLSIDGVIDGVFYEPRAMGLEDSGRLAALVVTQKRTVDDIRKALGEHIDQIFLPRPLRIVDRLPRMKTGKLEIASLRELIQEVSDKS